MSKLPKHLREMDPENLAKLQTGFARFRFGFAEPGEIQNGAEFVGNFGRKKDAVTAREACDGTMNPYLHGRLATGWSVWKKAPLTA